MNVQLKQMHRYSGNTSFTAIYGCFLSYKADKSVFIISDNYKYLLDIFKRSVITDTIGKDIELLCSNIKDGNNAEEIKPYCYRVGDSNCYIINTSTVQDNHIDMLLNFKDESAIMLYDTNRNISELKINLYFNTINTIFNVTKDVEENATNSYRTLSIFNFFNSKVDNINNLARKYNLKNDRVVGLDYNAMFKKFIEAGKGLDLARAILKYDVDFVSMHTKYNMITNFLTKGKLR